MALETFDYPDGTSGAAITGATVLNGGFEVQGGRVTGTGAGNRLAFNSQYDGVQTLDIYPKQSSSSNAGIFIRATDANNMVSCHFRTDDGLLRIEKKVGGVSETVVNAPVTGYGYTTPRTLKVSHNGPIINVYIDDDLKATWEDDSGLTGTLSGVRMDSTHYEADNYSYQTSQLPAANPAPTYVQSGKAISATKLGLLLPVHSQMVADGYAEEFWPYVVNGEDVPNWPSAKYPLIMYSSPDHSANGDSGVYVRVYNSELGPMTDGASWEEWQNVSSRTEFAHINKKTCPIFVDSRYMQTETPTVKIVDGTIYMFYHNNGVYVGPNATQNTNLAVSTNGIDFSTDTAKAISYDPRYEQGDGHTGYARFKDNPITKYPYSYLSNATHGGGRSYTGASDAIYGSNDLRAWDELFVIGRGTHTKITDSAPNGWGVTWIYMIHSVEDMIREGAYWRVTFNLRKDIVGDGVAAPYLTIEVLVDDDFYVVSEPNIIAPLGAAGEFDSQEMQNPTRFTYDGTQYCVYKGFSDDDVSSIGLMQLQEVDYDWQIFRTLADKTSVQSFTSSNYAGLTSNTTITQDGEFVNFTIPANGDEAYVKGQSFTPSSSDVNDFVMTRHAKKSGTNTHGIAGFVDDPENVQNGIVLRWPSDSDGNNLLKLELIVDGEVTSYNTRKGIGRTSETNEFYTSRQNYGIRVVPNERYAEVLDGRAVIFQVDTLGVDFTQAMTPAVIFKTDGGAEAISEFESMEVVSYSNAERQVADTTPPVVTNNGPATLTLTVGDTYTPDFSTNEGTLNIDNPVDTSTAGTYTVTATATDTAGNDGSATQTVIVEAAQQVNQPPTANAGPDQSVEAGARVQLNASMSTDPEDGSISQFGWEQVDNGADAVVLEFANTATPEFTAPSSLTAQTLEFRVQAQDSEGATSTDTVIINVAALEENAILSTMETLDFELMTQGNLVAYKGRANREVMQLKPSSTSGIVTAGGYLDVSNNGIVKVEIIADGKKISNENSDSIKIDGARILARLGDLDIPTSGRDSITPTFMIVLYVGSDTRGLVVASNATSGYKPLSYRVEDAA